MENGIAQRQVRVRLSVGEVEVEVECSIGDVDVVVGRVLDALVERGVAGASGVAKSNRGLFGTGRGETCKSLLVSLWEEGWFGFGRALGEVHAELGRRGFHYDRTAVAHALVDLVREGVLTRVGKARRYRYLQKRPPPAAKIKKKEDQVA